MGKPLVIGLVGPTASGKTALSMQLQAAYDMEIVCMDSMQVYRGMDIGTAKPTMEEQRQVPHHMLDVAEPAAAYDVAQYREAAAQAIQGILSRGRLPVLVGGTGLYLRALSLPLTLGGTPKDEAVRQRYQDMLEQEGAQAVHDLLARRDPVTAARLHVNDSRRVVRALEVGEVTRQPFSAQRMPGPEQGPYDIRLYALDLPREELYARIDRRVDAMLAEGLVDEVRGLLAQGVPEDSQAMQGLGYKELLPYLKGQADIEDTKELIKRRTRNYAKRQLTWFRADARVQWLKAAEDLLPRLKEDMEGQ